VLHTSGFRISPAIGAVLGMASLGSREAAHILVDQLAELPPDYREVLVLRHFQGLSFAEVGQQMRRSPGAVPCTSRNSAAEGSRSR